MKICTSAILKKAIEHGAMQLLRGDGGGARFLDEIRVGLHLDDHLERVRCADIATKSAQTDRIAVHADLELRPGEFYLGFSEERLRIPRGIFGIIQTRSKYARLGLELAMSSQYIAPGFGDNEPTPVVFEIRPAVPLRGLKAGDCYSYVIFFEIDEPVDISCIQHFNRFPFK